MDILSLKLNGLIAITALPFGPVATVSLIILKSAAIYRTLQTNHIESEKNVKYINSNKEKKVIFRFLVMKNHE